MDEDNTDWSAQACRNSRVYKESDIDLTQKEILRLMGLDVKEGEKCAEIVSRRTNYGAVTIS